MGSRCALLFFFGFSLNLFPSLPSTLLSLLRSFSLVEFDDLPLSASKTDMATIVKVMQLPDSGLEIRDRKWLKITIANAVIGEPGFRLIRLVTSLLTKDRRQTIPFEAGTTDL